MSVTSYFEALEALHEPIGAIVTAWSGCEGAMAEQIMWARAVPMIARNEASWPIQINTRKRIAQWQKIRRLLDEHLGIDEDDLEEIAERAKRLAEWRNLLVHGFYDRNIFERFNVVSLMRWDDDLGVYVDQPYLIDRPILNKLKARIDQLFADICWRDEMTFASTSELRATNSKAALPDRPEILRPAPKRLPV